MPYEYLATLGAAEARDEAVRNLSLSLQRVSGGSKEAHTGFEQPCKR